MWWWSDGYVRLDGGEWVVQCSLCLSGFPTVFGWPAWSRVAQMCRRECVKPPSSPFPTPHPSCPTTPPPHTILQLLAISWE